MIIRFGGLKKWDPARRHLKGFSVPLCAFVSPCEYQRPSHDRHRLLREATLGASTHLFIHH